MSINKFKTMLKLLTILLVVVFFSSCELRSVRDVLVRGDNSPLRSFYGGSTYKFVDPDPVTYNRWDFEVETLLTLDRIAAYIYDIIEVTNPETNAELALKLGDAYYNIYMVEYYLNLSVTSVTKSSSKKRSTTLYGNNVSFLQKARASITDAKSLVENSAALETIGSSLDLMITSLENSEYNVEVSN